MTKKKRTKSAIDLYVAKKIKTKRESLGYSQAELSYELKTSASFIGQAERASSDTRFSLERINEIAKIFNCKLTEFFPSDPL